MKNDQSALKDRVKQLAEKHHDKVVSWRRHIHQNPELSFQEFKTTEFIKEKLTELRIDRIEQPTETGVVHPFNVFFDFNHSLKATQDYVDTVNHYWLNEYKVDGFRFDLSKGFYQGLTTDVGVWSSFNAQRIDLLNRMASEIRKHTPDAIVILEHFAASNEEQVLTDAGMLVWGNANEPYAEMLMGWEGNKTDFSHLYYKNRGFNKSGLVGYMESHDEERQMFKTLTYGNQNTGYNTRNLSTALVRAKANAALFYTIPGPKMLWQFGELGYDISKDEGGHLSIKPTKWEYLEDDNRLALFQTTAELIRMKTTYPIFKTDDVSIYSGPSLGKTIVLKSNPFTSTPASANEMSVVIMANMDIVPKTVSVEFPHTGTWYNHFTGEPIQISATQTTLNMNPGTFHLFTNYPLELPDIITGLEDHSTTDETIRVYPNPANHQVTLSGLKEGDSHYRIYSLTGNLISDGIVSSRENTIQVDQIPTGIYLMKIENVSTTIRLIKK